MKLEYKKYCCYLRIAEKNVSEDYQKCSARNVHLNIHLTLDVQTFSDCPKTSYIEKVVHCQIQKSIVTVSFIF